MTADREEMQTCVAPTQYKMPEGIQCSGASVAVGKNIPQMSDRIDYDHECKPFQGDEKEKNNKIDTVMFMLEVQFPWLCFQQPKVLDLRFDIK